MPKIEELFQTFHNPKLFFQDIFVTQTCLNLEKKTQLLVTDKQKNKFANVSKVSIQTMYPLMLIASSLYAISPTHQYSSTSYDHLKYFQGRKWFSSTFQGPEIWGEKSRTFKDFPGGAGSPIWESSYNEILHRSKHLQTLVCALCILHVSTKLCGVVRHHAGICIADMHCLNEPQVLFMLYYVMLMVTITLTNSNSNFTSLHNFCQSL